MNRKSHVLIISLYFFILAGSLLPAAGLSRSLSVISFPDNLLIPEINQADNKSDPESLDELNIILKTKLQSSDLENSHRIVEKIISKTLNSKAVRNETLATSYYLVGIYYLFSKSYSEAIRYFNLTARIKEERKEYDERYANALYNTGVAYNGMGDFISQEQYCVKSLELEKKLYGDSSPYLVKTYFSLISACIGLHEYEKSLEYSMIALNISSSNPGSVDMADMASIFNNLGAIYMYLADYSKAKVYLEKTESIYNLNHFPLGDNYFSLLNNLAITYGFLGLQDKSNEYYERGNNLSLTYNSSIVYNYINSYAIILGRSGNKIKGEALLKNALIRAKSKMGDDSPEYFSTLFNYAEYLREFKVDNNRALEYYKLCLDYIGKNDRNLYLNDPLNIGYASSLRDIGDFNKALDIIQSLLFFHNGSDPDNGNMGRSYDNPPVSSIKTDKMSLKILRLKYQLLWEIYNKTHDLKILETTSSTAKLIVEVLERVRINISEEDSRLLLGDRYRDSYLNAIRDFNLLYHLTGETVFLENAFEFSEKSKVAGLLAATREMNASQFNIPGDLSDLEKKLRRDISFLSARIDKEINSSPS